jgi:hypothetical protein
MGDNIIYIPYADIVCSGTSMKRFGSTDSIFGDSSVRASPIFGMYNPEYMVLMRVDYSGTLHSDASMPDTSILVEKITAKLNAGSPQTKGVSWRQYQQRYISFATVVTRVGAQSNRTTRPVANVALVSATVATNRYHYICELVIDVICRIYSPPYLIAPSGKWPICACLACSNPQLGAPSWHYLVFAG